LETTVRQEQDRTGSEQQAVNVAICFSRPQTSLFRFCVDRVRIRAASCAMSW